MGLLLSLLPPRRPIDPHEEELLWNVLAVMTRVDGAVDASEAQMVELLSRTVPQLRAGRSDRRPAYTRKTLLEALTKVEDAGLRRQIFVLAIEAALASGDVNESEDQYADHLRRALRLDETYARQVIEVVAAKYAY